MNAARPTSVKQCILKRLRIQDSVVGQCSIAPIFRWAGSKRRLVPHLINYWSTEHTRYVEPFAGSACLFFAINPRHALLSDINAELIDAYNAIKNRPNAVHAALRLIPSGKESYYSLRATNPQDLDRPERAARFIFLNRYCFNGLYRTNRAGQYNVPYSPSKTGQLPSLDQLRLAASSLKRADLAAVDFEETLNRTCRGDFVYLDPPYALAARRVFTEYHPSSFSLVDLTRLSRSLSQAIARGVKFVLTYADCAEIREAFNGWEMLLVKTPRNISGFAKHRRTAIEVVITNT
jgi:DNA adenine methylase